MKLPIRKEFFDKIKNGEKDHEIRDAHLMLVCEETGETLRMDVEDAYVVDRRRHAEVICSDVLLDESLFDDDEVIIFHLTEHVEKNNKGGDN